MDPSTGTFTTMDTYGGSLTDPMSLHKYLFANSNPVMYSDPSGHSSLSLEGFALAMGMGAILGAAFSALDYTICALVTDPGMENHDLAGLAESIIWGWAIGALAGIGFFLLGLIPGLSLLFWAVVGFAVGVTSGVYSIACGLIDNRYGNSEYGTYEIIMGIITLVISTVTFGISLRAINTAGRSYSGELYRSSKYDPLEINEYNTNANHRYSEPGRSALYFGQEESTVNAELLHWDTNPAEPGRITYKLNGDYYNLLDLTDKQVLNRLGIDYNSITGDDYTITHMIGRFAETNGYQGIIAPSARAEGGVNVIVWGTEGIT